MMKNLSSWLIAMFAFMFWGYRVAETVMFSIGKTLVASPIDMTMEIVILFITFICICLIIKRNLLAVCIYGVCHAFYYGVYIYQNIATVFEGTSTIENYMTLFISLIALSLAGAAFFDVLLDKSRKANPKDKQTDWFYKNEQFDRKLDERADKNQYRTMWFIC